MSAGSNDDVRHTDGAKGLGKIFGKSSFVADKIAESEVNRWRRDVFANFVSEKVFELGSKVARISAVNVQDFRAVNCGGVGAETLAEFPRYSDFVGTKESLGSGGF